MMVRSSRVVQPPVSGVPVAGATVVHDVSHVTLQFLPPTPPVPVISDVQAGSSVSISILK